MRSQINNKSYNILIIVLGTLAFLPFLAPVFMYIGWDAPAKAIYLLYSLFCHQFSTRSILIFDYQIAWCARDTAIWIGIFLSVILVKYGFLPRIKWYHVLPFIIPMALDGGIQTIFTMLNVSPTGELSGEVLYISNNLTRFMTGALFGIGVGWWLGWQFGGSVNEDVRGRDTLGSFKKLKFVFSYRLDILLRTFGLLSFMFVLYTFLIFIWRVSSPLNPPLDFLDSAVRTPAAGFFDRRGLGACPTKGVGEVLNIECFFR